MNEPTIMAVEALIALFQLVGTIAAIGFVYGRIKTQLEQFKEWQDHVTELLGNGQPGVFLRRDEALLYIDNAKIEHSELFRRIKALEGK